MQQPDAPAQAPALITEQDVIKALAPRNDSCVRADGGTSGLDAFDNLAALVQMVKADQRAQLKALVDRMVGRGTLIVTYRPDGTTPLSYTLPNPTVGSGGTRGGAKIGTMRYRHGTGQVARKGAEGHRTGH